MILQFPDLNYRTVSYRKELKDEFAKAAQNKSPVKMTVVKRKPNYGKLCIKGLKMKFKHGDSFKTATRHYRQFDFYVQKNNINKPRDEEDVLVTLLLDSTTTLICDSRAICTGVEDK